MKHLFLINPAAGKPGTTDALTGRIEQLFRQEGLDFTIQFTQHPGQAQDMARIAAETGEPVRIYACGGDGTLNEVVNGAAGFDNAAVTNVPKGTGNDFLKIFGPDHRRGFCDLLALARGPQVPFDLINCGGRLGIGVVCAGIDARVAADVDRYKALPAVKGKGAYVMALVENVLLKSISQPMKVEAEDLRMDQEIALVCVCNGRYYGGGFMPVGEAMPDDGILDILVVPKVSRVTFARLVGDYAKGAYKAHSDIIRDRHCQAVSLSSPKEIVAVVDGEVMRGNEFHIFLDDRKVNFFYPDYLDYRLPAPEAL